jgi:hypothetical protein
LAAIPNRRIAFLFRLQGKLLGVWLVEVKRPERQMVFVQLAVLATTARVMADKLAQARRHYAAGCSAK